LTLTPGLNTKLFSKILKKNLSSLENSTRHNIPLDRALQAVAANGEIPVNMNDLLDSHHYVTVPVLTTVIFMILIAATIGGVVITHMKADNQATRQSLNNLNQALGIMQETEHNQELSREEDEIRPRRHHAPMPNQQHHKQQHTGHQMYHRRTQYQEQGDQYTC
jgi:hypothetical protein